MPFVANLSEQGGLLAGSILEPAADGEALVAEEIESAVTGLRAGRSVDFTKTYRGMVWTHSVDYVGQLSADGQSVTGTWSVFELDGRFEMHRDLKLEDLAEIEAQAEVPVSLVPAEPGR